MTLLNKKIASQNQKSLKVIISCVNKSSTTFGKHRTTSVYHAEWHLALETTLIRQRDRVIFSMHL